MNQILNTIPSKGFIIVHLLFCCLHRQHSLHTSTPPSHLMYTQSKTKIQRQKDVRHWEILPVIEPLGRQNYVRIFCVINYHTLLIRTMAGELTSGTIIQPDTIVLGSFMLYAYTIQKYVYTAIAVLENVLLDYVDYSQLCGILSTSFSLYYATWQRTSDQWNISQF